MGQQTDLHQSGKQALAFSLKALPVQECTFGLTHPPQSYHGENEPQSTQTMWEKSRSKFIGQALDVDRNEDRRHFRPADEFTLLDSARSPTLYLFPEKLCALQKELLAFPYLYRHFLFE